MTKKSGWDKSPTDFVLKLESELVKKRKQITIEALQGVVMASPVDTGAYRASHQLWSTAWRLLFP